MISALTKLSLDDRIVHAAKAGHTNADAVIRFFSRPTFDGEVEPGAKYIIVEDMIVMGGTVTELRKCIEKKGGQVVALTSLGAAESATILPIGRQTIEELEGKYGRNELE